MSAVSLTAGCTATNPQQTALKYDPSDGETVTVGKVDVDNLLIVSRPGSDGPGTLVARLTNTSSTDQSITFDGSGSSDLQMTFPVPGNGAVSLGPDQQSSSGSGGGPSAPTSTTFETVGVKPGTLLDVTVSDSSGASKTVAVPVLTSAQPYYSSLVPPTPTPTPTYTPPPMTPSPSGRAGRTSSAPMTPAPRSSMAPSMTASMAPGMTPSTSSSMSPSYSPRATQSPSSSTAA